MRRLLSIPGPRFDPRAVLRSLGRTSIPGPRPAREWVAAQSPSLWWPWWRGVWCPEGVLQGPRCWSESRASRAKAAAGKAVRAAAGVGYHEELFLRRMRVPASVLGAGLGAGLAAGSSSGDDALGLRDLRMGVELCLGGTWMRLVSCEPSSRRLLASLGSRLALEAIGEDEEPWTAAERARLEKVAADRAFAVARSSAADAEAEEQRRVAARAARASQAEAEAAAAEAQKEEAAARQQLERQRLMEAKRGTLRAGDLPMPARPKPSVPPPRPSTAARVLGVGLDASSQPEERRVAAWRAERQARERAAPAGEHTPGTYATQAQAGFPGTAQRVFGTRPSRHSHASSTDGVGSNWLLGSAGTLRPSMVAASREPEYVVDP